MFHGLHQRQTYKETHFNWKKLRNVFEEKHAKFQLQYMSKIIPEYGKPAY